MKILVIGAGYVGLVSATCFAESGYHVECLDIDKEKVKTLNQGEVPIYELGLKEMMERNIEGGRLHFTHSYEEGVSHGDICFIAVDTPSDQLGACDLSNVRAVATSIAEKMESYKIIVMKSTAPVGTCEMIRDLIATKLKQLGKEHINFDIASNPEFLKEGCAIEDFMKPDRVIIGVDKEEVGEKLSDLYAPFNVNTDRILVFDWRSSEMTKYASNAMLATRISFMNELSGLCERTNADISKVRKGIGADKRIGHAFLYAGIGFGGSCFPKDIRALRSLAYENAYPAALLDAVDIINKRQKHVLSQKVIQYFGPKKCLTLAVWGLAFKPNTDDMREASSLIFIQDLVSKGYRLKLYDPVAMDNAKLSLEELGLLSPQVIFCKSEYEAAEGVDGIALLTEWKQFRQVEFDKIKANMKGRVIFDGRNQYRTRELAKHGFDHIAMGRRGHFEQENASLRDKDAMNTPTSTATIPS